MTNLGLPPRRAGGTRFEQLAEPYQTSARVRLDRPQRQPGSVCNLLLRHPLIERQLQHLPLLGPKVFEHATGTPGLFECLQAVRFGPRGSRRFGDKWNYLGLPRPAAMPVDESAACDRGNERTLGGHRCVEPPRVPP